MKSREIKPSAVRTLAHDHHLELVLGISVGGAGFPVTLRRLCYRRFPNTGRKHSEIAATLMQPQETAFRDELK
jgi:hypothetical protein